MNEKELERILNEIEKHLKENDETKKKIIDKWIRPVLIAIMIALVTAFATSYKNLLSMEQTILEVRRDMKQMKEDINFNFSIIEDQFDNNVRLKRLSNKDIRGDGK